MLPGILSRGDQHTLWIYLSTLALVWLFAALLPSPSSTTHMIQQILPSVRVDFHPSRSPYNESKLGLMVDSRPLPQLAPLLLHMMSVAGPDWRFLFLGSNESVALVNTSFAVRQQLEAGRLSLREMPEENVTTSQEQYSQLFTNLAFYESLLPAEFLWVFHADSVICANSEQNLDDWLEYDWVGAPWDESKSVSWNTRKGNMPGGDGGFSLRRISRVMEVLRFQTRYVEDIDPEDEWLAARIGNLPNAKMASPNDERRFCVEDQWYEQPMGYHLGRVLEASGDPIWNDPQRRRAIFDYCPEVKMVLPMVKVNRTCF
ncbi:MAG: hypothetical protein M1838_004694 [Thelocarpon superellum]|nr:MAG: hypothetical protein M1838_004694 [Thelocarpon superellum]